jgi:hypothetical protein
VGMSGISLLRVARDTSTESAASQGTIFRGNKPDYLREGLFSTLIRRGELLIYLRLFPLHWVSLGFVDCFLVLAGKVTGKVNSRGARFDPQRKKKILARREAENAKLALLANGIKYLLIWRPKTPDSAEDRQTGGSALVPFSTSRYRPMGVCSMRQR